MPTITVISRLKAGHSFFLRGASALAMSWFSINDITQINNKNPHGPISLNNAEPLRRSAPSTLRGPAAGFLRPLAENVP